MKTDGKLVGMLAIVLALAFAQPAFAYVGPGSSLTLIGTAIAAIGSIVLVLLGFVWYPLKRLWRSITGRKQE